LCGTAIRCKKGFVVGDRQWVEFDRFQNRRERWCGSGECAGSTLGAGKVFRAFEGQTRTKLDTAGTDLVQWQ
jgi:hypothetical protein